jgi:hypothetical protein
MPTPVRVLARAASEAVRARKSFEARQRIRAGSIDVAARVRCLAPDRVAVEYETYTNPFTELEDLLGGNAEFVGSDLEGSSLSYDGRMTSFVSTKTAVALRSAGRSLYEPIPGIDALGETRFLDDLARDYLLLDKGDGAEGGRATRILGLKPKRGRVASVFRVVVYPFERADVALDAETLFPLRIEFVPSPELPISPFLGPKPLVTIEYTDVRELDLDEAAFAPSFPAGTRLFEETLVAEGELGGSLPFPLPFDALRQRGYELVGPRLLLVLDAARERGFATVICVKAGEDGEGRSAIVLRVGNYVSRHMARRRGFAAERGELTEVGGRPARYVDRRLALADLPASAEVPSLADLTWEFSGVFWVLTGEALGKEDLLALASTLA